MSAQNTLVNKRARSLERAGRKARSTARINPRRGPVIVGQREVRNHRYLGFHGLAFSATLASVFLGSDSFKRRERDIPLDIR